MTPCLRTQRDGLTALGRMEAGESAFGEPSRLTCGSGLGGGFPVFVHCRLVCAQTDSLDACFRLMSFHRLAWPVCWPRHRCWRGASGTDRGWAQREAVMHALCFVTNLPGKGGGCRKDVKPKEMCARSLGWSLQNAGLEGALALGLSTQ